MKFPEAIYTLECRNILYFLAKEILKNLIDMVLWKQIAIILNKSTQSMTLLRVIMRAD